MGQTSSDAFRPDSTGLPFGALAGLGVIAVGWTFPAWLLPAGIVAGVLVALRPGGTHRSGLIWALGLGAAFATKDLLPSPLAVHWRWVGELPGGLAPSEARQPEFAQIVLGAIRVTLVLWAISAARSAFVLRREVSVWSAGVLFGAMTVSAWVLTHPAGTASYGRDFSLGTMASRNGLGAAFVVATLLGIGGAMRAWRHGATVQAMVWLLPALLVAWGAVALGSRGAWLALLVGVGTLVFQGVPRRSWSLLVASALVAVAFLIVWLEPVGAGRVGEVGADFRWQIWRAAVVSGALFPLVGCGTGMFEPAFAWVSGLMPPLGASFRHPDSSVVQLLYEHGLVGAFLLTLALGAIFRRRDVAAEDEGVRWLRRAARAAVAALAVAAIFDVTLHRPGLLVLVVPLLGIAWPVRAAASLGTRSLTAGVLIALLVLWAWADQMRAAHWVGPAYLREGRDVRLAPAAAAALAARPLDVTAIDRAGADAFRLGEYAIAARHWQAVMHLQPANDTTVRGYAVALQPEAPEQGLPFWRHHFARSGAEFAANHLSAALTQFGRSPIRYWRRTIVGREDLLVLLAAGDEPGARECYEAWRELTPDVRFRSPFEATVQAVARWGDAEVFSRWVEKAPRWEWSTGVQTARGLVQAGRTDLAWPLLSRMLHRPAFAPGGDALPLALLRARAADFAAVAAALGADEMSRLERVDLLRRSSEQPGCPPALRLELAYCLAGQGEQAEAVALLLAVAEELAGLQPRDW